MRRSDICLYLGPADRAELQALINNRNTPRKLVWRAEIVLATADGQGTFAIMRRTGMSQPTVWRWQARYLEEGVAGLKRDKTRPSRVPPLPMETRLKVIAKTVQESPPNATHKTPEVRAWLEKHPRFKLHFTPTSASWLNLVERFFAEITSRRIRRGSYSSVNDLEAAIYDYLAQHNEKPKPFRWTKTADDILARERRAPNALDEIRGNR